MKLPLVISITHYVRSVILIWRSVSLNSTEPQNDVSLFTAVLAFGVTEHLDHKSRDEKLKGSRTVGHSSPNDIHDSSDDPRGGGACLPGSGYEESTERALGICLLIAEGRPGTYQPEGNSGASESPMI